MKALLEVAFSGIATALGSSWRLDVQGDHTVKELREAQIPVVFTVWHAFLLPPLWHRKKEGITLLVSDHGDAEYLASTAIRFGYNVVRGSSTRGAVKGSKGLLRALRNGGDAAITPDGPTGPARVAKAGAVAVAARAGAAIIPIGAGASAWWRLGSWDRFFIPRPFARVRIVYGEPLLFQEDMANAAEQYRVRLGRCLDKARVAAQC